MEKKDTKVIVIGGGISGLSALKALTSNGFENTILLEATPRLGGRISTRQYGNHVVDMGAQWIHGEENNAVFELAEKHDLAFRNGCERDGAGCIPHTPCDSSSDDDDDQFYMTNGQRIDEDLVDETCLLLDNIFSEGNKFSRESIPLNRADESIGIFAHEQFYKYLRTCGKSEHEKRIMEGLFRWRCLLEKTDNACTSVYEMSLYAWGEYLECPGNSDVPMKRGFSRVIDVISEGLLEKVKLNTPVQCIYWRDDADGHVSKHTLQAANDVQALPQIFHKSDHSDGVCHGSRIPETHSSLHPVAVKTSDGDVIEADHVIITCSLGYLKKHAQTMFKPLLPYDKMAAIHRMGFGTVDKIYLEFERPFWDDDCDGIQFVWLPDEHLVLNCLENKYAEEYGDWWREFHGFDTVQFHPTLLCGWIAGEEALVMERIPDHVVLDVCHELLQRFTGKQCLPKPVRITRSKWHSESYVLGSYSFVKLGSSAGDCDILAQPVPSNKMPRLLFAGEATHKTYFSTTHGALLSGQREAQRLVGLYNQK